MERRTAGVERGSKLARPVECTRTDVADCESLRIFSRPYLSTFFTKRIEKKFYKRDWFRRGETNPEQKH